MSHRGDRCIIRLAARVQRWAERPERPMTPFREWRIRRGNDLCPSERTKAAIDAIAAVVAG